MFFFPVFVPWATRPRYQGLHIPTTAQFLNNTCPFPVCQLLFANTATDLFQVVLRASVQGLPSADLLCTVACLSRCLPQRSPLPLPSEHEVTLHQTLHREWGVQYRWPEMREHYDVSHATHLVRRETLSVWLHQDIWRCQRRQSGHRWGLRLWIIILALLIGWCGFCQCMVTFGFKMPMEILRPPYFPYLVH